MLDRGEVRQAQQLAAGAPDFGLADLLEGWRLLRAGDPPGSEARLRPLVSHLERTPGAETRAQAHALLALGVATVLGGRGDAGTALLERAMGLHDAGWLHAQALRFCALALEQRGAWQRAADRYDAAARAYARIGDLHGEGSALYGAATALSEADLDDRAWARIDPALDRLRRSGFGPAIGAALGRKALLAAETQGPAALCWLDEARAHIGDAGGVWAWNLDLQRAEVLLRLDRPADALAAVDAALDHLPPRAPEAAQARHLRALARLRLGQPDLASEELARIPAEDEQAQPGSARLERAAVRLLLATHARPLDLDAADRALAQVARGQRAGWHRRGVATLLSQASYELLRADGAAEAPAAGLASQDLAARALQLAVALSPPTSAPPSPALSGDAAGPPPSTRAQARTAHRIQALRQAGARVPIGPLHLEEPIGRGGMGEVWRARHRDGEAVAVKLLRMDRAHGDAALFEAEVQALARLDHPGVVRVLAALPLDPVAAGLLALEPPDAEGRLALVMELVAGGSLEEQDRPWPWPEQRTLLEDLLDALAHAHARGILHLDIKPGNVLLEARPHGPPLRPRLTDFGLAGLAMAAGPRQAIGTPTTMAPEQALPDAPLSPATDLYALGCLAWRLATGAWPFQADDAASLVELHRRQPPPPFCPRTPAPTGLEAWLRTLLAKRPEDRFACAADAAAALRALDEQPLEAAGAPAGPAPQVAAETLPLPHRASRGAAPTLPLDALAPGDTTTPLPRPSRRAEAPTRAAPPRPAAPFPPDWRPTTLPSPRPFLWGAGEGLFRFRVGHLVGRPGERDRLWATLGQVHADGMGRALWVRSAPGMGRSALLSWLEETARRTGAATVRGPDALATRGDRPTLVLLDDPDPAWAALRCEEALAHPCLLVVASTAPAPRGVEALELGALDDQALLALLDARLPLDRALASALVTRAAGSPAFAVALLTDLVRRDALVPGPEGFHPRPDARITLPDSLRALWSARLDALAPPEASTRAAWALAATLGARVDHDTWTQACAQAGLRPDANTWEPLLAEGWVGTEAPERTITFQVAAVREALLAAAGPPAAWHAIAARVLPAEDPAIGPHLAAAGRHAEALGPLRRAAADAVNATRLQECRDLLDQWDRSADALGMAADDPRRASPLVVRVHLALHSHEDPHPLLDRALAIAEGEVHAQLLYTRAWVLTRQGRDAEAEPACLQALERAREVDQPVLAHLSRLALATARYAQGKDADDLATRLRQDLEQDAELLVRLDACEGRGARLRGQPERAETLLRRAVEGARRVRAPDVQAEALAELATLCAARGDREGELDHLQQALRALEGTGSDKALQLRLRLAQVLTREGRSAEAEALRLVARRYAWRLAPA